MNRIVIIVFAITVIGQCRDFFPSENGNWWIYKIVAYSGSPVYDVFNGYKIMNKSACKGEECQNYDSLMTRNLFSAHDLTRLAEFMESNSPTDTATAAIKGNKIWLYKTGESVCYRPNLGDWTIDWNLFPFYHIYDSSYNLSDSCGTKYSLANDLSDTIESIPSSAEWFKAVTNIGMVNSGFYCKDVNCIIGRIERTLLLTSLLGDTLPTLILEKRIESMPSMFSIHPNPCYGNVFITSPFASFQVFVYDVSGKMVFSSKNIGKIRAVSWDTIKMAQGIYLVKVVNEKATYLSKIFVIK